MLKTIFFDLDDTLLDFSRAEAEALRRAFRRFDIDPAPDVLERYHVINREQWELLEEGVLTRARVLTRRFDLLFEELGVRRSSQEICDCYESLLAEGHWFVPGAPELLAELAPWYDLYLASNGAAAVQWSRLNSAGIGPYFKNIFISEELGADKPSPAFFAAAFAAVPDFDPASALMVGDSLTSDIRGGRNAGIRTCWFNPQGKPARPDIAPDHTIRALSELPDLLNTL